MKRSSSIAALVGLSALLLVGAGYNNGGYGGGGGSGGGSASCSGDINSACSQVLSGTHLGAATVPNASLVSTPLVASSNLSDLGSASTARTNLGLGSLATASTLPNPSASTLGGIESIVSASHQWIDSISTSGVPHQSQPSYSDLSGSPSALSAPTLVGINLSCTTTNVLTCATSGSTPSSWAWNPGDIFIAELSTGTGTGATCNAAAGWVFIGNLTEGSGSLETFCMKRAQGEGANVLPFSSNSGTDFGGFLLDIRYSGNGVVDLDQSTMAGGSGLGTPQAMPTPTTLRNNELVVWTCVSNNATVTVTGTGIASINVGAQGTGLSTQSLSTAGVVASGTCQTSGAGGNASGWSVQSFYTH